MRLVNVIKQLHHKIKQTKESHSSTIPINRVYYLTLSLPVTHCQGHNADLVTFKQQHFENGESKHCLHSIIFEEYLISFVVVFKLIDFALVVL